MQCPRCGSDMTLDTHRRYPLEMCYHCGYIEGRRVESAGDASNFAHLRSLDFNEAVVFLSDGLGLDPVKLADWLDDKYEI